DRPARTDVQGSANRIGGSARDVQSSEVRDPRRVHCHRRTHHAIARNGGARSGDTQARLLRDNVVVYEGKIGSLRRFKDDVSEVKAGFECGIGFEKYNDLKVGDVIEAFVVERAAAPVSHAPTLP